MAYKKYIYRNGKKFGPYYYESYRDKNGKVKKRYVKREDFETEEMNEESFHKKLVMSGIFIFVISLIIFLGWNGFFEVVLFSDETGYGLRGEPVWNCGLCKNGIRTCNDESGYGYKSYSESCVVEDKSLEDKFILSSEEKNNLNEGCEVDLECGDWGECKMNYNLNNLINEDVFLNGSQVRTCIDKNNCVGSKTERKRCRVLSSVTIEKVNKCSRGYIEIRNLDEELISRFEFFENEGWKLNIDVSGDESC